ncbi:pilus assembly PilX family protein [Arenimonas metalli]|uniref:Type 4 fimbrial biogenesis protein PilX N-terminal domain-containing protein n=1 Tax=Arenimonas metalli CF5-1 TaxID=1384056 RepID=A0A091BAM3_9GAMM|nr:PilX N-terminal domain-containing pilus assembly protein [Arenimonas metalli]KFN47879.1 hypothetical protein N787_07365 [Arenimonas metalli CF5-1]
MTRPSKMLLRSGQRGVALLVVLLLLLIVTLLGLASLRGVMMEERMSASLFDRGLMFQAAESALREGEARTATTKSSQYTDVCDTTGLCGRPNPGNLDTYTDRWLLPNPPFVNAAPVTADGISVTPGYFIEFMGVAPNWPGCDREIPVQAGCLGPRYRVTARARVDGRSEVLLQSSFTSPD